MHVYSNLDSLMEKCAHCGECCRNPGILLPEQVDVLAGHFGLSDAELFSRYLIAGLITKTDSLASAADCVPPVFILSPVKVDSHGERAYQRIADRDYAQIRNHHCIFWDSGSRRCSIYDIRPFGCSLLLCSRMTNADAVGLGTGFYYHKWKNAQETVFAMLPGLKPLYERMKEAVAEIRTSFVTRDRVIHEEIAAIFDGYPHEVPIVL